MKKVRAPEDDRAGGRGNERKQKMSSSFATCLSGSRCILLVFRWHLRDPDWDLLENKNALIESEWRQFVLIIGKIVK